MKQLILHIPHASTKIPDHTGYLANCDELEAELLKLTDWYTDELFTNSTDNAVIAPFSRVFCDVERFTNDSREPMAKVGMGVLYRTRDNGDTLRTYSPAFREKVLRRYYRPHHQRLTRAVQEELDKNGNCLIVDCHSYPDLPLQRDKDQSTVRPDFCIGTDPFHTPPELAERAAAFFRQRGYTTEIDTPYNGALVPGTYYRKNRQVQALMLEVNRRLYLKPGTNKKNTNFGHIKTLVQDFLNHVRET